MILQQISALSFIKASFATNVTLLIIQHDPVHHLGGHFQANKKAITLNSFFFIVHTKQKKL